MTYESPFAMVVEKMATEIAEKFDGEVMTAISKYHIDVNKDELVKALAYDRGQYEKGYADGFADGLAADRWISVKDRLPDDGFIGKLIWDNENGPRICGSYATITLSNGEKVFAPDAPLTDYLLSNTNGTLLDQLTHITHWMPLHEPPEEAEENE